MMMKQVMGQHPVYATGPALIFFTILLLQYYVHLSL